MGRHPGGEEVVQVEGELVHHVLPNGGVDVVGVRALACAARQEQRRRAASLGMPAEHGQRPSWLAGGLARPVANVWQP